MRAVDELADEMTGIFRAPRESGVVVRMKWFAFPVAIEAFLHLRVTRKLGLLHWTSIPVDFIVSKNGSFSRSPVVFAPFNMTRTRTPF